MCGISAFVFHASSPYTAATAGWVQSCPSHPFIWNYCLQRYCGVVASSSVHGTVLQNNINQTKIWCAESPLSFFMGPEPPTQMTSGRLTDQYMGIYLQLFTRTAIAMRGLAIEFWIWRTEENISCAWDPCLHRWVDRTKLRSVHRSVPPSAGISIFNRKSRIRILGGVSRAWK